MSDVGEDFKLLNELKAQQKVENRIAIMKFLNAHEIPYRTHNFEEHIVIDFLGSKIDIWPSTNKAKFRDSSVRYPAIYMLNQLLKNEVEINE